MTLEKILDRMWVGHEGQDWSLIPDEDLSVTFLPEVTVLGFWEEMVSLVTIYV